MNTEHLTLEQFSAHLDRLGADLAQWPPDLQSAARALMQASGDARRLHEEALRFDACLDAALPPLDTSGLPALKRRVMERVNAQLLENSTIVRFWQWLTNGPRLGHVVLVRPAALAMLPLIFGFVLGMSIAPPDAIDGELATELTLFALTDRYEGFADAQ
jgi:hypothetical protein